MSLENAQSSITCIADSCWVSRVAKTFPRRRRRCCRCAQIVLERHSSSSKGLRWIRIHRLAVLVIEEAGDDWCVVWKRSARLLSAPFLISGRFLCPGVFCSTILLSIGFMLRVRKGKQRSPSVGVNVCGCGVGNSAFIKSVSAYSLCRDKCYYRAVFACATSATPLCNYRGCTELSSTQRDQCSKYDNV